MDARPDVRRLSIDIAGANGPEGVWDLVDKALSYYETGVIDENGKLIRGSENNGCAMVYVWPSPNEQAEREAAFRAKSRLR